MRDLIKDILYQRKQIVERPVKNKSRGRTVEKNKKNQRHSIQLHLALQRHSFGIDGPGKDVDHGHQDGQQVQAHSAQTNQSVRTAQVPDRSKGGILEERQA